MNISSMDNPNRELTDEETISQLLPLIENDSQLIAINQEASLILLKHSTGQLETFSYCVSHVGQLGEAGWTPKLQHYLRGSTHHTEPDIKTLFTVILPSGRIVPVGKLKSFRSDTELLYVHVHRVGKRRKYIDDIGNVFVKAFNKAWKYPEQVSY